MDGQDEQDKNQRPKNRTSFRFTTANPVDVLHFQFAAGLRR